MKRYGKLILLCALICLIGALILGCAGTDVETDTETEVETEAETEQQAHVHTSTAEPVNVVISTCQEKGYADYRCDECLESYREELPLAKHDYAEQYEASLGYEIIKCNGCGDWRMEIDGKEERTFAAQCSGNMSLTFKVLGDDVSIRFTVDGASYTETYSEGTHTVTIAEGLSYGGHTFGLAVQNKGGAVDLTDISIDGTLYRAGSVILEMTKAKKNKPYGDFYVYVQTSDPTGDYYIQYYFRYQTSTTETGGGSSFNNAEIIRINAAKLVKVTDVSDAKVTYTDICDVLQQGEIALAIREKRDGVVDHIGGVHGDEHVTEASLYADGTEIVIGGEDRVTVCSFLEFYESSVINRCNTPGDDVMLHDQQYRISADGITCTRTVEWLVDDFVVGTGGAGTYLQMFTMRRLFEDQTICEIVEAFDGQGNSLGKASITDPVEKEYTALENTKTRCVKYSSASSGFSGEVRFEILSDDLAVENTRIKVRVDSKGDNKWYASFKPADGDVAPDKGDVWVLEAYYNVDYVTPES